MKLRLAILGSLLSATTLFAINFGDIPANTSEPASTWEAALGNPSTNGFILSSTTTGTRSWIAPSGGGGAPTTSTYITQTPDATLSSEQALSALSTGLLKNTTGTGVLSIAVAGTDYLTTDTKWDGGATGLTASTGRTSLGGTTVGQNMFTLTNPSAISFLQINADNSVTAQTAAAQRTALSLVVGTNVQAWDADLDAIAALGFVSTSFLKKTAANTWALDTNTYLTANQTITLSGDTTGSGTTAITTATTKIGGKTYPTTATTGKVVIGNGSNYVESTPTFPNASATSGKVIKSDGTNWVASTETYAAPGVSGNVLTSDGTNWTSAAPTGGGGGVTSITATAPIVVTPTPLTTTGVISISGVALTKTDDTNVTLTLGGTPSTALVTATSLTLGWTGTLAVARGGTGVATAGAQTVFGNNTGATAAPGFSSSPQFTAIGNLTSNGFVKTGGGIGTLSVDTSTYLTSATGVTTFASGNLSPLFTVTPSSATSGAITQAFTLSTAAANTVFGNATASTAAPTFSSSPRFTAIGNLTTNGLVTTSGGVGTLSITTAPAGAIIGDTDTQTLTNKRVNPRINTSSNPSSLTINSDTTDQYNVTGMAQALTINAPSGTPVDGQKLIIRFLGTTGQTLTFNAIFRFSTDLTAPTTTVSAKTLYMGFVYNAADTKWDNIAQLGNL